MSKYKSSSASASGMESRARREADLAEREAAVAKLEEQVALREIDASTKEEELEGREERLDREERSFIQRVADQTAERRGEKRRYDTMMGDIFNRARRAVAAVGLEPVPPPLDNTTAHFIFSFGTIAERLERLPATVQEFALEEVPSSAQPESDEDGDMHNAPVSVHPEDDEDTDASGEE